MHDLYKVIVTTLFYQTEVGIIYQRVEMIVRGLHVLIMSLTHFRVNLHPIVA